MKEGVKKISVARSLDDEKGVKTGSRRMQVSSGYQVSLICPINRFHQSNFVIYAVNRSTDFFARISTSRTGQFRDD